MEQKPKRLSLMAHRERYLWLWSQVKSLDLRIQQLFSKPSLKSQVNPEELWLERLKLQLRRFKP